MHASGGLSACCVILLAGCATVLPPPPAQPEVPKATARDAAVASAIATHRQQAERYASSGDHAAAAREWRILTLLAPDDPQFSGKLAATRAAIAQGVREQLQVGNAALRNGDVDRASIAMLKVLSLDPDNAEAARALRDIDRQKLARIQNSRATRAGQAASAAAARAAPAETSESYDIDQRIEMFRAGDIDGGLAELRAYVDANPNNQAARQRIAATVYERGRESEGRGAREQALMLYEEAVALRGKPVPEWTAQAQKLRKSLSEAYYDKGMQAYRTDTAAAIKLWEASVRFDPENRKAAAKLQQAKVADAKLKRIEQEAKPK